MEDKKEMTLAEFMANMILTKYSLNKEVDKTELEALERYIKENK